MKRVELVPWSTAPTSFGIWVRAGCLCWRGCGWRLASSSPPLLAAAPAPAGARRPRASGGRPHAAPAHNPQPTAKQELSDTRSSTGSRRQASSWSRSIDLRPLSRTAVWLHDPKSRLGGPQALSEYEGNQTATPSSSPSSSGLPSGPRSDPYAASRAVNEEGQSDRSGGPAAAIDPYG
jgi:hypothetical protein